MPEDIPLAPIEIPTKTLDENVNEALNDLLTSPFGARMSTYTDILEILSALGKAGELIRSVLADGKVAIDDLTAENLKRVEELIPLVKEAIDIKNFDISSLSEEEVAEILEKTLEVVFIAAGVKPTGDGAATYTEISEIMEFLSEASALFSSYAEDGTIAWTDILANIPAEISLGKAAQVALKINGKLDVAALSQEQISGLLQNLVTVIYSFVSSVKKLKK